MRIPFLMSEFFISTPPHPIKRKVENKFYLAIEFLVILSVNLREHFLRIFADDSSSISIIVRHLAKQNQNVNDSFTPRAQPLKFNFV
jgi:hypothetical protein